MHIFIRVKITSKPCYRAHGGSVTLKYRRILFQTPQLDLGSKDMSHPPLERGMHTLKFLKNKFVLNVVSGHTAASCLGKNSDWSRNKVHLLNS